MPVQISGAGTIIGLTSLSLPLTGLLKGTGSGSDITVATSGTDYAPATIGTAIFYGNGSGGFSNVTVGTGLSFSGGTLSSTTAGTVTSTSVVSANGFAGTVATATTTPAITLTTTLTGLLKGNGTAMSAATAGTDYVTPTGSETLTNKTLTNPTITNYTETPFTANTGTAITIALTNGTVQILTLTGSPTITMPTAVAGKSFIIMLKTGAGSFTVTWSTVKWPASVAPTITSTASRQDVFSFFSDGANWYGSTLGQNYTP